MAGGEVVPLHGLSINANRFGSHFLPLSTRMFIHRDLRWRFHPRQRRASSLMMGQPTSMKFLMNAGRILLTAAHRVASCVHPDRVPPRLPVQRSGSFHRVPLPEFTQYTSASLPCARRLKARSTLSVTRAKTIRWWSIRRFFQTHFMLQMGGSISVSTTSQGQAMSILS
jgi:hypothetical protein